MKTRRRKPSDEAKADEAPYPSPETTLQAITERNGLQGRELSRQEFDDEFSHLPLKRKD